MGVAIDLLGPFRLLVGGQVVPDESWSRRDAASLVKLLALSRDGRLHREQVMDSLWGDLPVLEAAPRLHKAAHFARRATGRADTVVLRGEMVLLFPGETLTVDAHEFESTAQAALAAHSAQAAAAAWMPTRTSRCRVTCTPTGPPDRASDSLDCGTGCVVRRGAGRSSSTWIPWTRRHTWS